MDCGLALVACSRCGGVDGVIRGCGSVVRVRICGFVAFTVCAVLAVHTAVSMGGIVSVVPLPGSSRLVLLSTLPLLPSSPLLGFVLRA
jgi:hypothetical protein